MLHSVPTTYKIILRKAFNENIDESWIDWAIQMTEAGFESNNLYMLAGSLKPYNQFELQELTSKVLEDLGFEYRNKDSALRNYLHFILANAVDNPELYLSALDEIKDYCFDPEMGYEYQDFWYLYWAKADLMENEHQWYWDDADRNNIDDIIRKEFQKFIEEYDKKGK